MAERLSEQKRAKILKALERGESTRALSKSFRVNPRTVCRILETSLNPKSLAKPRRCPTCGAMVRTKPCIACAVRDKVTQQRERGVFSPPVSRSVEDEPCAGPVTIEPGGRRMNLLRRLLELLAKLPNLPDITDPVVVRQWLAKIVDFLFTLSALTPTMVDDLICKALRSIVNSDEAWELFWKLLQQRLRPDNTVGDASETASHMETVANMAGVPVNVVEGALEVVADLASQCCPDGPCGPDCPDNKK